jgi:predicted dienelactone hydrolase
MRFTTRRALGAAALVPGAAPVSRSRRLAALIAAMLALGLCGQLPRDAAAAASAGSPAELPIGHTVKRVVVPAVTSPDARNVDVHVWYPADPADIAARPITVYRSALHGRELLPAQWDPLSWTVEAEIAREGAAVDPQGGALPVIVFTHGNINDPIDYAHTLERIAAAGFVVAAPYHANNTQDDVRIDFVNRRAGATLFFCSDGLATMCSRPNVPISMADRVRDISKILEELPDWFGDRVNARGVGVLGHSRGTATALAAAGGSTAWGFEREPHVKAIMGMAIASPLITAGANLKDVTVPALLVAGTLDQTSPPSVSEFAYGQISSADKRLVYLENAVHRSFDSTYCDQLQASGAVFDTDRDGVVETSELTNTRPILDRHTFEGIHAFPLSGLPVQYCSFASFTSPTDIRAVVASLTGFNVTADNVPSTGLDSDKVKKRMAKLAVKFFSAKLERDGDDVPDAADS